MVRESFKMVTIFFMVSKLNLGTTSLTDYLTVHPKI